MISSISKNLRAIVDRARSACARAGRDPARVKILAASKRQPVELMLEYARACLEIGITPIFGENYVQDFAKKGPLLASPYEAHMIGPLQRNKAKEAVRLFDVIESVGSLEVAKAVSAAAEAQRKIQRVFLQINISRDERKSGFDPDALLQMSGELWRIPALDIRGLMTITRLYENHEDARPDFRAMSELGAKLLNDLPDAPLLELSMGMSDDFETAIEEGATVVRIGTALFGERQ